MQVGGWVLGVMMPNGKEAGQARREGRRGRKRIELAVKAVKSGVWCLPLELGLRVAFFLTLVGKEQPTKKEQPGKGES